MREPNPRDITVRNSLERLDLHIRQKGTVRKSVSSVWEWWGSDTTARTLKLIYNVVIDCPFPQTLLLNPLILIILNAQKHRDVVDTS